MTFQISRQQIRDNANRLRDIIAILLFGIYWSYSLYIIPKWMVSSYNLVSLWVSGIFLVLGFLTTFSFERKKEKIGLLHAAYCSAWINTFVEFIPNDAFGSIKEWELSLLFTVISVFLVSYKNLYELGLRKLKGYAWGKTIFTVISTYLVVVFVSVYANSMFLKIFNIAKSPERIEVLTNDLSFIMIIFVIIIGPFGEELFFRGIIQQGLNSRIGTKWSIILTALFFSIAHVDITSCVALFIGGLYYSWLRAKYNNLWITYAVHVMNNSIFMSLLFL